MENKNKLSMKDRISIAIRHQYLQGSWNYERMQNGGCYLQWYQLLKNYIQVKKSK